MVNPIISNDLPTAPPLHAGSRPTPARGLRWTTSAAGTSPGPLPKYLQRLYSDGPNDDPKYGFYSASKLLLWATSFYLGTWTLGVGLKFQHGGLGFWLMVDGLKR